MQHGKWNIGDGRSVYAWDDIWIEVGICISDHVQSIPESLKGIKVRDFVNGSGILCGC